jgi:hypothetical protein
MSKITSDNNKEVSFNGNGTSIQLFRAFIVSLPNGLLDASKVHSRECYLDWLANRNTQPTDSELKKFQRALSNHLSGVDGRSPFFPEEERAILEVLREKRLWPCCVPGQLAIGRSGYRSKGYHEKLTKEEELPASKKQKVMTLLKTSSSCSMETEAACSDDEETELAFPSASSTSSDKQALDSYDLPGLMEYPCSEEDLLKGWLPVDMCFFS